MPSLNPNQNLILENPKEIYMDEFDIDEKQISIDPMSVQPKFISASLPNSISSSPNSQNLNNSYKSSLVFLPRSKSCGDGRSSQPSEEFDILARRRSYDKKINVYIPKCSVEYKESTFKCGALCLFLPKFAKKKQDHLHSRRRREVKDQEHEEENDEQRISRMASLEKFECASWSSSIILDVIDYENDIDGYFDLPVELIRANADDTNSPIRTAFVFDKEERIKGVLKKSSFVSRKSHESSNRHVRFSLSTPSTETDACT